MLFTSRKEAGRKLARILSQFADKDTVILALPRGGVVTGVEVANVLHAPLGFILVRKIGHPAYVEYAIGAIAENGKPVYNQAEVATLDKKWLKESETNACQLIATRRKLYFDERYKAPEVKNKTVIIVDDGIATGLTMQAAVLAIRDKLPKRVVVAVPVAPQDAIDALQELADEVIVLDTAFMGAVGSHYLRFPQVEDDEVRRLLERRQHHVRQTTATHPKA